MVPASSPPAESASCASMFHPSQCLTHWHKPLNTAPFTPKYTSTTSRDSDDDYDSTVIMHETVEPRLIALLNDAPIDYNHYHNSLSLPPLKDPNILKSSGRPAPLEPDASNRSVKHSTLPSSQTRDLPISASVASLENLETPKKSSGSERALGGSSPQSLRKILDNPDSTITPCSKKRDRIEINKEEFVQLPQPPKKQRAVKQPVPPIIIGLFEPPPQTAIFPPIASSSFHDSHGRNSLNIASSLVHKPSTESGRQENVPVWLEARLTEATDIPRYPKQAARPRRKWTEDETIDLLRGAEKHGIGKWTVIANDSEFGFSNRKAVDLKDRWRVVCPIELRRLESSTAQEGCVEMTTAEDGTIKLTYNSMFVNINVSSSSESEEEIVAPPTPKPHKTKAHRKNLSDLANLGISQLFVFSNRRPRRLFTEEEDRNILLGFQEYGNQWAMIVKDEKYGLMHRKPTDIRDRIRNKWPEKHAAFAAANSGSRFNRKEDQTDNTNTQQAHGMPLTYSHGIPAGSASDSATNTNTSQESMPRVQPPVLPAPATTIPSTAPLSNHPAMGSSFSNGYGFSPAPSAAPAQFMSFSEMLNGDDWGPHDGAGLAGLEENDVVG